MVTTSEPMKALVAISEDNKSSLLLKVWPEDTGPGTPWGSEFEAIGGSRCLEDLYLGTPNKQGIWVWEGKLYYPGPNFEGVVDDGPAWKGTWRRATSDEILSFSTEVVSRLTEDVIHE